MSIGPSVLTFTFASGHITLNARVLVQSLTSWERTLRAVDIQTFSDLGRNLLDNSICDTRSQLGMTESGEVSRALRYCNTKPTRDRTGASS